MSLHNKDIRSFGNVPIGVSAIESAMPDYNFIQNKICSMEHNGQLIRLRRGLYVQPPSVTGKIISLELVANHIYSPSYVTGLYALRYYGLIPELVYTVTSATTGLSKRFVNKLGTFEYRRFASDYYHIGIRIQDGDGCSFLIASPEKALCDLICMTSHLNLRYMRETMAYLEEDLRFDMDAFWGMDKSIFEQCVQVGAKRTMIGNLIKLIERNG